MAWRSSTVKEVIVYTSTSNNIWANLAFEDWVFQNVDLTFRRILFIWKNLPCVVIGRHQNPWLECNVPLLRETGVPVVRRRSGGGAVYHDLGNLNVTMFSHRNDYDRPRNLQLVVSALNRRWNTELSVNKHNDIICQNTWKVSGSSSKLARSSTYHHFTLLLNADTIKLHQYLNPNPELRVIKSTATPSRRSNVLNLQSLYPSISSERVTNAIADEFYHLHGITHDKKVVPVDTTSEDVLSGITGLADELQNWDWNYGKTPKFTCTAQRTFSFGTLEVTFDISGGRVVGCHFTLRDHRQKQCVSTIQDLLTDLQHSIIGSRLWRDDIQSVTLKNLKGDSEAMDIANWLSSNIL